MKARLKVKVVIPHQDAGSDGCISLSNSLSLAEAPRIKYLKKQRERGELEDRIDPCVVRHGQILICKTYIGNR
jgi:hypothetical protein